jgi:hypothetical protein
MFSPPSINVVHSAGNICVTTPGFLQNGLSLHVYTGLEEFAIKK